MSAHENLPAISQEAPVDENKLIAERREKLKKIRENGNAFPNDFRRDASAGVLQADYSEKPSEYFDEHPLRVVVAGRVMAKRLMGKASFLSILDDTGRIQLYVARDAIGEAVYEDFKTWDLGDMWAVKAGCLKPKRASSR